MSSKNVRSQEGSVSETRDEQITVVETPEMWPSVSQERQATIDYANERALDGRLFGQTLVAEERMHAREWEIERTRRRVDARQESTREARTQRVAKRASNARRCDFEKRAASVDPFCDPDAPDPREQLSRAELAAVNQQTWRLAQTLSGWSRAAISRRVAEQVVSGKDLMGAVLSVFEELQTAPGHVVPISAIGETPSREVDVEGRIEVLWEVSNSRIQQVGLIADASGKTKVTVWKRSDQPWLREGEYVRIRHAAKSWYEGRVSLALTGWSTVSFPERGRW